MAAHNVACSARSCVGQFDVAVERLHQLQVHHAAEHAGWRFVGDQRKSSGGTGRLQGVDAGGLPFFAKNPDLLEQVIETDLIIGRRRFRPSAATVGGVCERAEHRVVRTLEQAVVMQVAVLQFDAAIGLARDVGVVRDHQDRVTCTMQVAESFHHDGFVFFVEVAGRFVGQD